MYERFQSEGYWPSLINLFGRFVIGLKISWPADLIISVTTPDGSADILVFIFAVAFEIFSFVWTYSGLQIRKESLSQINQHVVVFQKGSSRLLVWYLQTFVTSSVLIFVLYFLVNLIVKFLFLLLSNRLIFLPEPYFKVCLLLLLPFLPPRVFFAASNSGKKLMWQSSEIKQK